MQFELWYCQSFHWRNASFADHDSLGALALISKGEVARVVDLFRKHVQTAAGRAALQHDGILADDHAPLVTLKRLESHSFMWELRWAFENRHARRR